MRVFSIRNPFIYVSSCFDERILQIIKKVFLNFQSFFPDTWSVKGECDLLSNVLAISSSSLK